MKKSFSDSNLYKVPFDPMTNPGETPNSATSKNSAVSILERSTTWNPISFKLTPNNYQSWKAQFVSFAGCYELGGVLDGTESCPVDPTNNLWRRQDQLLCHALITSVSETITPYIAAATTAHQAWDTLAKLYANRFYTYVITLKERLQTMKHDDCPVSEYLHSMKIVADELRTVDHPLTDNDLTVYILNGLRPEFCEIAASLQTRDPPLSFVDLHNYLVAHEKSLHPEDVRLETPVTAHHASTSSLTRSASSIEQSINLKESKWMERSIHKVPSCITQLNETAYMPRMVSFGPYHHEQEHLRQMEEHKWRALLHLLRRSGKCMTDFRCSLVGVAPYLKACYNPFPPEWEGEANLDRFLLLLMLDGFFMLEILRFANNEIAYYETTHPIFSSRGKLRIMPFIRRDMLMLENQLPMLLLKKLLEIGLNKTDGDDYLNKLILKFYFPNVTPPIGMRECKHVLDVFRKYRLQGNGGGENGRRTDPAGENGRRTDQRPMRPVEDNDSAIIRSAIELNEAGIRFEQRKTVNLTDIKFNGGVLTLPMITVNDTTETMFLNLMAFERFNSGVGNEVTSYVAFMDCIIDSERDVALLHSAGIVRNALGSDRAVAEMFNSLSRDAAIDPEGTLHPVHEKVAEYCKKPWNKWRASLIHNYFSNPWTLISLFAAIFLFALTIVQTIYTIYPNNPR